MGKIVRNGRKEDAVSDRIILLGIILLEFRDSGRNRIGLIWLEPDQTGPKPDQYLKKWPDFTGFHRILQKRIFSLKILNIGFF